MTSLPELQAELDALREQTDRERGEAAEAQRTLRETLARTREECRRTLESGNEESNKYQQTLLVQLRDAEKRAGEADNLRDRAENAERKLAESRRNRAESEGQLRDARVQLSEARRRIEDLELDGSVIAASALREELRAKYEARLEEETRRADDLEREAAALRIFAGMQRLAADEDAEDDFVERLTSAAEAGTVTISRLRAARKGAERAERIYESVLERRMGALEAMSMAPRRVGVSAKEWLLLQYDLVHELGGRDELDYNGGSPDEAGFVYFDFGNAEDLAYARSKLAELAIEVRAPDGADVGTAVIGVRLYEPIAYDDPAVAGRGLKRQQDFDECDGVPLKVRSPEGLLIREAERRMLGVGEENPRDAIVSGIVDDVARLTEAERTRLASGQTSLSFKDADSLARARRVLETLGVRYRNTDASDLALVVVEPLAASETEGTEY
jgi:hypothetical protein